MHRSISIIGLAVLAAACGGNNGSGPAAGFECLSATLPTTAPANINVTGQIKANALAPNALAGAEVLAKRTENDTIAADTSDTPGFYSLAIATGGTPVNGFLRVRHSGYMDAYGYPSRPLAADLTNNNVLMITTNEFAFLGTAAGVTQTTGNGFMGVVVKDCSGTTLAGATVTTNPAGTVRYNASGAPSQTATTTASDGVAYVFNLPVGNVTVMATVSGHTLRQHVVNVRADVITVTEIQP